MATLKLDIPGLGGGDPQQQAPAPPPPPPPPINFAQFASNPMAQQKVSAMIPGLPPPPPPQQAMAAPPPFTPPPAPSAPPPSPSGLMASPNPKGLIQAGNLPILNRPTVQNADGTHSSEYSTSFQDENGREVLVPTIVNGKFLTPDGTKPPEGSPAEKTMFQNAWQHYQQTKENLGQFDNPDDADVYAGQLHNRGSAPNYPFSPQSSQLQGQVSGQSPSPMTDLPTLQSRLSQAASPSPMQSYQDWQGANPNQQEKPTSGIMKALQIAAGILSGGVPGGVGAGMAIHQHDLPAGLQGIDQQRYQNAVVEPYKTQQGILDTQAQMQQRQSLSDKYDAQADAVPQQQATALAKLGLKAGPDGLPAPDEASPVYQQQQAKLQFSQSQIELNNARTEYQKAAADAKTNPNNPALLLRKQALQIALKNAQTAAGRLGLSTLTYDMRAYGTDGQGNALPGAVLGDDDTPVGTGFQNNVKPTGTERNKGDMAQSAHEQLGTLQSIVKQRPDIFGPAAGRKTDFNVWLGSQDPDAQRFRAARTIAGDHLAGTFGGRSEYALKEIDDAIGQFKDNPAAVSAGLDQLDKANNVFLKRGTPRVSNGRGGVNGPVGGGDSTGGGFSKTATGPNGHKIGLKGGQWVDVQTGKAL